MPKTKRVKIPKNTYTRKQKQRLADKVYDISDADVLEDFNKLREIGCEYHKQSSQVGNRVVNKYTAVERLDAYGKQRVNFYDLWQHRRLFKKKQFVKKMLDFYKKNSPGYPELRVWFRISNLYYSAVSIFRPLVAMDVYCRYKANTVLDFTMGWGGRLVGACAVDLPKYIGIDNNIHLKTSYSRLSRFLKKNSSTEIELYFQDSVTFDYSKIEYDLVLTSPPYYNIEVYGKLGREKTKEEWNRTFYIPVFEKTFKYLKKGGYYCLNIPIDIYENVAHKVLGNAMDKIPLPKSKRFTSEKYTEFIYVWRK